MFQALGSKIDIAFYVTVFDVTESSEYRPFVYIAAIRRTGSTVLSEVLTRIPSAFIFREPGLGRDNFSVKQDDAVRLAKIGVDLKLLQKKCLDPKGIRPVVSTFKEGILPLLKKGIQIGVKEIRHSGWENYRTAFPAMKVIMTGRDPRDIYISLYYRRQAGKGSWKGPYTPKRVAADLNAEFNNQLKIAHVLETLPVRYEDMCTGRRVFSSIKTFVSSPIPDVGEIGGFLGKDEHRYNEHVIHGSDITRKRVHRWRNEPDKALLLESEKLIDLMPEYCAYWGYDVTDH